MNPESRASRIGPKGWWLAALALFILRLGLAFWAPLGDDEGYYWVWSKHPALSYYDHPPLVAWLVAASTSVFGTSLFALRIPFLLLGTLTAVVLRRLTKDCLGDADLAGRASLLFQITPVFLGLGFMVIPDTPLLFFWVLAAWLAWRALQRNDWGSWLATGLALGGALLGKYTAFLFPASLAGFLAASRRPRLLAGLFMSTLIAVILFAPVIVWNARHHWASLFFQFVGRHEGSGFNLGRFFLFLGSQAVYLSPVLFILLLLPALRIGFWKPSALKPGEQFFWWLAAPALAIFSLAALFADFKPNWPAVGYVSLLPLGCLGLERWRLRAPRAAKWTYKALTVSAALFAIVPASHLLHPFLPFPQGKDPTADMRGWKEAARKAEQAGRELEQQNSAGKAAPFFAAGRYQLSARLEFYLPGRPSVICLNPGRDAYDDWQNLDALSGRNFVFVANDRFPQPPEHFADFDSSRVYARVAAKAGPRATHTITIYKCWGFRNKEESIPDKRI